MEDLTIIHAVPRQGKNLPATKRYTHMRVKVVNENGITSSICVDTGASNKMVDRKWLDHFIGDYEEKRMEKPLIAGGIIRSMELSSMATFDIDIPATDRRGKKKLVRVKIDAWIHEAGLKPNLLLGNEFIPTVLKKKTVFRKGLRGEAKDWYLNQSSDQRTNYKAMDAQLTKLRDQLFHHICSGGNNQDLRLQERITNRLVQ
ncbi:hypothetical protein GGR54DRAFT_649078 [Hypoxylon sp. NC1633]|nr:hypothetical protein GGR54DRAFT_649078 [Hypoxylon sp. NC1633]